MASPCWIGRKRGHAPSQDRAFPLTPTQLQPKVLIATTSFLPVVGGLQFELKWLLDNLDRRVHNDDVEVHFAYPNDASLAFVGFRNIQIHDLGIRGRRRIDTARLIVRLARLIRRIRPSIVHCHVIAPDTYAVMLAARIAGVAPKFVATAHGQDVVWLPDIPYGNLRRARSRFLTGLVTKRLAAHVAVSHAMAEHAANAGTREDRIRVIHNGIPGGAEYDFEVGGLMPFTLGANRAPGAKGDDAGMTILCLSSARAVKNVTMLVEAVEIAKERLGDWRLCLTCSDPGAESLRTLVREKGLEDHVLFIGTVTGRDKRDYFHAADVFCLPSRFEAFGLAALEAMKFGAVVVASKVGGVVDFIESGQNGVLVASDDPKELANVLTALHADPRLRKRLAENGRKTAERFSITSAVDQHVRLYKELAS